MEIRDFCIKTFFYTFVYFYRVETGYYFPDFHYIFGLRYQYAQASVRHRHFLFPVIVVLLIVLGGTEAKAVNHE